MINVMRLLAGLEEPLLAPLQVLPAGAHVVQVACGTGGLSLALARRRPDLRISKRDVPAPRRTIWRSTSAPWT
jgi:16S rRNA G1207 methylase RsmC